MASSLEDKFLVLWCERFPHLPAPEEQYTEIQPWLEHLQHRKRTESPRCRRWQCDFAWPEPIRVIVELQGGVWFKGRSGHGSPKGLIRDYARAITAQAGGWLFFPLAAPHLEDPRYIDLIASAVASRATGGSPAL